jgi:nitrite reductase (NO-forming)
MTGVFPPLAQSDFLMHDADRAIRVLLEGLQGPVTVNGQTFNGVMPDFSLTDHEIASVLSYVRTNFGNSGSHVTPTDVQRVRGILANANASSGSKDRTASERR